jgi:hypothetical protein
VGVNSGLRQQQHRVRLSANVLLNSANLLLKNFIFSNIQQQSANRFSKIWRFSNIQQCRQSASPSNARARCSKKKGVHARAQ